MKKIAVIGNGRWAQNHIKALKELDMFAGACDIGTDYKYVIRSDVSGVVIATNAVMHFPITQYALRHNVPVYCEKPICTLGWQLDELLKLQHNAVFQGGFQLLFDPDIQGANEAGGHSITTLICRRLGGNYRNESSFQTLGIHDLAVAMYLMGSEEIEITHAWGNRAECNVNLRWALNQHAIIHTRYARPDFIGNFRQMDFVYANGFHAVDSFDNHKRSDLLKMSLEDWIKAIDLNEDTNRVGMEFSVAVQRMAFEIDLAVGVEDSKVGRIDA